MVRSLSQTCVTSQFPRCFSIENGFQLKHQKKSTNSLRVCYRCMCLYIYCVAYKHLHAHSNRTNLCDKNIHWSHKRHLSVYSVCLCTEQLTKSNQPSKHCTHTFNAFRIVCIDVAVLYSQLCVMFWFRTTIGRGEFSVERVLEKSIVFGGERLISPFVHFFRLF